MTSCCCSVDVDIFAEVYMARKPTARKTHVCCECGESILPGEEYEQVTGKWDGYWETHKTCRLCLRIRNDLFPCGWYFGMMREEICECLGFDYITNELMSWCDEEANR